MALKKFLKKLTSWLKAHRKGIFFTILFIAALAVTASVAYHKGQEQGKKTASKASSASSFLKDWPERLKEQRTKNTAKSTKTTNTNSGFFRLSGTVQKVDKTLVTIKLANGTLINLTVKADQTYLNNGSKAPISQLKKNTSISATGTISGDGNFGASVIQTK